MNEKVSQPPPGRKVGEVSSVIELVGLVIEVRMYGKVSMDEGKDSRQQQ